MQNSAISKSKAIIEKSLLFILATILLDTIGIGLLVPIFPKIITRFATEPGAVSKYFGFFVGSYALMQFIAAPVLGALSDRFGRKRILLISLMGAALDYLFMAYAPTIELLILGRVIAGLTGASMTVASSYVADISDEKSRSHNFGLIGAAWGLGFIAGPLLGALLDLVGPKAPFFTAALLNLLNFFFGIFVLPESLSQEKRRALVLKRLNPLRSIIKILKPSKIAIYVWLYFLIFLAGQSLPINWNLYTEMKFHWSSLELGVSLSFMGVIVALSQGLLTRYMIPRLGEERAITVGILFYAISFLLFSLSTQSWMLYVTILIFSLTGIAIPSIQSLMSRNTPANEQGELQGSLVSLGSLSSVVAPLIFTPLFIHFTRTGAPFFFPGVIFSVASGISLFTLALWFYYQRSQRRE
ncbi:MAG TPA: TCR/Tet family MFS transporter [Pseudobdellovibrionaceae bacterium]